MDFYREAIFFWEQTAESEELLFCSWTVFIAEDARLIIHRPTCAHILLKVFFAVSDEIQSLGTIMKFT